MEADSVKMLERNLRNQSLEKRCRLIFNAPCYLLVIIGHSVFN